MSEEEKEIARLKSIISEIHSWIVCACITTPEDMAENFDRVAQITDPEYKGKGEE
jgi:hypothetical protein